MNYIKPSIIKISINRLTYVLNQSYLACGQESFILDYSQCFQLGFATEPIQECQFPMCDTSTPSDPVEPAPEADDQFVIRCQETGSTSYLFTITKVDDANHQCAFGIPILISYKTNIPVPEYCTITSEVQKQDCWQDFEWCQGGQTPGDPASGFSGICP